MYSNDILKCKKCFKMHKTRNFKKKFLFLAPQQSLKPLNGSEGIVCSRKWHGKKQRERKEMGLTTIEKN